MSSAPPSPATAPPAAPPSPLGSDLEARRARLEQFLLRRAAPPALPRRSAAFAARAPLPRALEDAWLHARRAPELPLYNEPVTIHYRGRLDAAALERAFNEVLRRHEAWRTSFSAPAPDNGGGGEPEQVIAPELRIALPVHDLRGLPPEAREAEALRLATEDARVPIPLDRPPLFRARLIRLADEEHRLFLALSHLIFDGVALYRVFLPELAALYGACAAGRPSPLAEPARQYADYACWRRARESEAALAPHLEFWRRELADLPAPPPWPGASGVVGEDAADSFRGGMFPFRVPPRLAAALRAAAADWNATLFQVLHAGFVALLRRYSGQTDFAVGGVGSARSLPETQTMLGYFLNTTPLRVKAEGEPGLRELTLRCQSALLSALEHDSVSLGRLARELARAGRGATPLFTSLISLEPPLPPLPPGWALTQMDVDTGVSKYDLYLEMDDRGPQRGLLARFHYARPAFDADAARRASVHWLNLLAAGVAAPVRSILELPLLGEEERAQIALWNRTDRPRPAATAAELVAAQAKRSPGAPAVSCGEETLSYGGLMTRARELAARLGRLRAEEGEGAASARAGEGGLIAIFLRRSLELPVAVLAVLLSGAAYLPLDPDLPPERLAYILADARPWAIVATPDLAGCLPPAGRIVSPLPSSATAATGGGASAPTARPVGPKNLAYVIYTSGSTGRPKGVQIEHAALTNFLLAMRELLDENAASGAGPGAGVSPDVVAKVAAAPARGALVSVTTPSFDIFGLELFLPLISGGRVYFASREETRDGAALARRLDAANATMFQATPATYRLLLCAGWTGRTGLTALCGGEALPPRLARELLPRCAALWNVYGPTETTIWSTAHRVTAADLEAGAIPIGSPLANTEALLLDERGEPVPIGVAGELLLGGAGLARGYLRQPSLTAERFIARPGGPGARWYRTGDLCRRRGDGVLEFLGRNDAQIKLRGHRIELAEIESALERHPAVRAAAVALREEGGEAHLAAYFVAAAPADAAVSAAVSAAPPANAGELRAWLRHSLPEAMIPTRWARLDSLPLTPNGKLNRRALAAIPAAAGDGRPRNDAAARGGAGEPAALTPAEARLAVLWREILGLGGGEALTPASDFFALGGHSLLALRLFARLEREWGRPLPVNVLFAAPTLGALAARLEAKPPVAAAPASIPRHELLLLRKGANGSRVPPLCWIPAGRGYSLLRFREASEHLDAAISTYGLSSRLPPAGEEFSTVEERAAALVELLAAAQPRGPCCLAGFCAGGLVAYEAARRLRAAGREVGLTMLINTSFPEHRVAAGDDWRRRWQHGRHELRRAGGHARAFVVRPNARDARGALRPLAWPWRAYRRRRQAWADESPAEEGTRRAFAVLSRYRPRPYAGRLQLVLTADCEYAGVEADLDPRQGWRAVAEACDVTVLPGEHDDLLKPPRVAALAAHLHRLLSSLSV